MDALGCGLSLHQRVEEFDNILRRHFRVAQDRAHQRLRFPVVAVECLQESGVDRQRLAGGRDLGRPGDVKYSVTYGRTRSLERLNRLREVPGLLHALIPYRGRKRLGTRIGRCRHPLARRH